MSFGVRGGYRISGDGDSRYRSHLWLRVLCGPCLGGFEYEILRLAVGAAGGFGSAADAAVGFERHGDDLRGRIGRVDGDVTCLHGADTRVPDLEPVAAGRHGRERGDAVGGRLGEVRRGEDDEIGGHPVVDVAAESDDARLVEEDWGVRLVLVEREFERFGFRERIDVVLDLVAVGETDARAGDDGGDLR